MALFLYVSERYGKEQTQSYETLAAALAAVVEDIEANTAYPLELYEGDTLLYGQRDGHPLQRGSCPLTGAAYEWARANGLDV